MSWPEALPRLMALLDDSDETVIEVCRICSCDSPLTEL